MRSLYKLGIGLGLILGLGISAPNITTANLELKNPIKYGVLKEKSQNYEELYNKLPEDKKFSVMIDSFYLAIDLAVDSDNDGRADLDGYKNLYSELFGHNKVKESMTISDYETKFDKFFKDINKEYLRTAKDGGIFFQIGMLRRSAKSLFTEDDEKKYNKAVEKMIDKAMMQN